MKFNPAQIIQDRIEARTRTGPTPTWSFSSRSVFKECPQRIFLKQVKRLPDPSGPAAERGSLIHDQCESYVRGDRTKLPEGKKTAEFKDRFNTLRQLFDDGFVEMEENWGFTNEWTPCDWEDKNIWHKSKLDVFIRYNATTAKIIDHKTGRKFGNTLKHNEQGLCYAIAAIMRYPELEYVEYEFWYLDQGETMGKGFNREQLLMFKEMEDRKSFAMTSAVEYPAMPSDRTCKWCPYKEDNQCVAYTTWKGKV